MHRNGYRDDPRSDQERYQSDDRCFEVPAIKIIIVKMYNKEKEKEKSIEIIRVGTYCVNITFKNT